jgi:hypothetical protein
MEVPSVTVLAGLCRVNSFLDKKSERKELQGACSEKDKLCSTIPCYRCVRAAPTEEAYSCPVMAKSASQMQLSEAIDAGLAVFSNTSFINNDDMLIFTCLSNCVYF